MAQIRFLGVSDMHAGARASLATCLSEDGKSTDPGCTSPTARGFGLAVRALLGRHNHEQFGTSKAGADAPTVLLLGDVMDLAFCDRNNAALSYVAWMNGLTGGEPDYFAPDMVFLPGNHDHSLWTAARMAAEARDLAQGGNARMPKATPALAGEGLPVAMITALNKRAGFSGEVRLRYPNFALHDAKLGRCVAFHHGHFIETTYRAMSLLHDKLTGVSRPKLDAATLSDENANWIDFGWSSFGQASDLSRDVVTLYSGLSVSSEAHHLRQRMARAIGKALAPHLPMGGQDQMKSALRHGILAALDASFGAFSDEERASIAMVLSSSGIEGLRDYIDGPVVGQLTDELGHIPPEMTFVFGHTHKPFADALVPKGGGPVVQVCNTGGWYLDSPRLNGREGVSLILIDEALNVVSVHCFATPENGKAASVSVRLVSHHSDDGAAFAAEVERYVAADQPIWDALSATAASEYERRQNVILDMLNASDHRAHESGGVL